MHKSKKSSRPAANPKSDPPVLCAGTNPNETESVDGGEDTAAGIYFWKFCKINYWEHGHITPSYLCICRYPLCVFHSFRYPLLHLHRACFVFDYFQICEKQGPPLMFIKVDCNTANLL